MDYFFESIIPSLIIAAVVALAWLTVFIQTGRYWAVGGLLVSVPLIVAAGWALDHYVVTDREAILNTLTAGARAAESNDLARVLEFVEPGAITPTALATAHFLMYEVRSVHVSAAEVRVNQLTSPPTADTRVTVRIAATQKVGGNPYPIENTPVRVTLQFRKHGDRWLVYGASDPELVKL